MTGHEVSIRANFLHHKIPHANSETQQKLVRNNWVSVIKALTNAFNYSFKQWTWNFDKIHWYLLLKSNEQMNKIHLIRKFSLLINKFLLSATENLSIFNLHLNFNLSHVSRKCFSPKNLSFWFLQDNNKILGNHKNYSQKTLLLEDSRDKLEKIPRQTHWSMKTSHN